MDQQENQEAPESLDEVIGELSAVLGLDTAAARLAAARMLSGALEVLHSMSDSPEDTVQPKLGSVNTKPGSQNIFPYNTGMSAATKPNLGGRPKIRSGRLNIRVGRKVRRILDLKKEQGESITDFVERAILQAAGPKILALVADE